MPSSADEACHCSLSFTSTPRRRRGALRTLSIVAPGKPRVKIIAGTQLRANSSHSFIPPLKIGSLDASQPPCRFFSRGLKGSSHFPPCSVTSTAGEAVQPREFQRATAIYGIARERPMGSRLHSVHEGLCRLPGQLGPLAHPPSLVLVVSALGRRGPGPDKRVECLFGGSKMVRHCGFFSCRGAWAAGW